MSAREQHAEQLTETIKGKLEHMPDYVTDYYYDLIQTTLPKTQFEYIIRIGKFVEFMNELGIEPKDVTRDHVNRFMSEFMKYSVSYRKLYWSALNSFFSYMYLSDKVSGNVMEKIKRPSGQDKVKRHALSLEDINKLLNQIDEGYGTDRERKMHEMWKERDKLVLMLLIVTGMRRAALTEINIEDIDFRKGILTVIDKKERKHVYDIYEVPQVKYALKKWLKTRKDILEESGKESDALFINNKMGRLEANGVYLIVKAVSKEALGYEIHPHDLRRSFVTNIYEETGDIEAAREAVGHARIETTRLYIKESTKAKKRANEFFTKKLDW